MGSPAFQLGWEAAEERRAHREAVQDEERQAELATIENAGLSPEAQEDAIRTLYAKDPSALKQHIGNLVGRLVGRKPKPVQTMAYAPQSTTAQTAPTTVGGVTLPAPQPVTVSYSGARTQAERRAQDLSGGRTATEQQLGNTKQTLDFLSKLPPDERRAAEQILGVRMTSRLQNFRNPKTGEEVTWDTANGETPGPDWVLAGTAAPSVDEKKRRDYQAAVDAGYKGSYEQWVAEEAAKGHASGNPPKPVFKIVKGHEVLIDPVSKNIIKDFGPSGTVRTTQRQEIQYDQDGTPHMVTLTSVSTPGGGSIDVDADPNSAPTPAPASKGPAPKKRTAPSVTPKHNQLDFRRGTPAFNKAQGDVVEATKLANIADQVAQHPNDAINQKRLAVALERASAGRFTTQALDYIIKAGWGNTIEQWANNPTTGALPADVLRQLVDGAHQNLKAAQDAANSLRAPAPRSEVLPAVRPGTGNLPPGWTQ